MERVGDPLGQPNSERQLEVSVFKTPRQAALGGPLASVLLTKAGKDAGMEVSPTVGHHDFLPLKTSNRQMA